MEEIIDPARNYPIAAAFSLTITAALYSIIMVGYYSVMQQWEVLKFVEATATLFVLKAFNIGRCAGNLEC